MRFMWDVVQNWPNFCYFDQQLTKAKKTDISQPKCRSMMKQHLPNWLRVVGRPGLRRGVEAPWYITYPVRALVDGEGLRGRRVPLTPSVLLQVKTWSLDRMTTTFVVVPFLEASSWSPRSGISVAHLPRLSLLVLVVFVGSKRISFLHIL